MYAKNNGAKHYHVSAKSGVNLNELFLDLADSIFEVKKGKDKLLVNSRGKNPRIKIE